MAIRPKRYESRGGRKIRAVKVTERNYEELSRWAVANGTNVIKSAPTHTESPEGDISNHRIRLHLAHKGIRVARVGDYLLHILEDDLSLADGTLHVMKGYVFESPGKYTEIKKV